MTDSVSKAERSRIMSRIHGRDTKPELVVRSLVHRMGYRFRLHRADLPGKPDLVLPRHRKVIFVHGCFWHGHEGCARSRRPSSNVSFWSRKLDGNIARDARLERELKLADWRVLIVWECETWEPGKLGRRLRRFLGKD